jgi:hypothetical protein
MIMQVNALVTNVRQERRTEVERVSARTALFAIFTLSLLSWMPIILPVLAYFHR